MYFAFWTIVAIIFLALVFKKEVISAGHSHKSRPGISEKKTVDINNIQKVVREHADCTAEVVSLAVNGYDKSEKMKTLSPGDPLELRFINGRGIGVYIDSMRVGELSCPDSSRIPALLRDGTPVYAYLGGRDADRSYINFDFCSIIVFYKVRGIPPTKVNLE